MEEQIEKIALQFKLARTQLTVLHQQYAGLMATGRLTLEMWNSFLNEAHLDSEKLPLDLDPEEQERLITTNLEFLGNYSIQIAGMRRCMADANRLQYYDDLLRKQEAEAVEGQSLEEEILSRLEAIYNILKPDRPQPQERSTTSLAVQLSEGPEGASALFQEKDSAENTREVENTKIQRNAGFMEPLDFDEEQPEEQPMDFAGDQPVEEQLALRQEEEADEGLVVLDEVEGDNDDQEIIVVVENPPQHRGGEARRRAVHRHTQPRRSRDGDVRQERHEEHRDILRDRNADELAHVDRQLLETRDSKYQAEQEVNELRQRRSRARRRFLPARPNKQTQPCAFCLVRGDHYSDACPRFPGASTRERLARGDDRCTMCLLPSNQHVECKREEESCRYCGSRDHHPALCAEPERSEQMTRRIAELSERIKEYDLRIELLTTRRNQLLERH
ncbi:hypothetical protein V3C99_005386 [Haemonchus contortus]